MPAVMRQPSNRKGLGVGIRIKNVWFPATEMNNLGPFNGPWKVPLTANHVTVRFLMTMVYWYVL